MWQLLLEIFVVAFLTAIIGTIITFFSMGEEREKFKQWGLIILIFGITGALIHIICEFSGINKYYCKHGNACLTN
jgi:uncharacterized membrane protein